MATDEGAVRKVPVFLRVGHVNAQIGTVGVDEDGHVVDMPAFLRAVADVWDDPGPGGGETVETGQ